VKDKLSAETEPEPATATATATDKDTNTDHVLCNDTLHVAIDTTTHTDTTTHKIKTVDTEDIRDSGTSKEGAIPLRIRYRHCHSHKCVLYL